MQRFRKEWLFMLAGLVLLASGAPAASAQPAPVRQVSAPAASSVAIPRSTLTPDVDGSCFTSGLGGDEYGDATQFPFTVTVSAVNYVVQVWVKHTVANLFVCMNPLYPVSGGTLNGPNAVVYIDRTGLGGAAPNSDTFAFSVSYSGNVLGQRGGSSGYNGPAVDSADYQAARFIDKLSWSAEFSVRRELLGGADWESTDQTIGLAMAQQWVTFSGDDYGWPNGYIWDVPSTWGRGNIVPGNLASTLNLNMNELEVTQSIQDLANSVALVARKRTFVRGHVGSNQTLGPVTARLLGTRAGVSLGPPLLPINQGASIIANLYPRRVSLNDSFLWELPASWTTAGVISITAELNPLHSPSETDYSDNSRTLPGVSFQTVRPLQIRLYDVQYTTTGGISVTTGLLHQVMLESWLRREYPIHFLKSSRRVVRVEGSTNPLVTNIAGAAMWVNGLMGQQQRAIAGNDPGWLYVAMVNDTGGFMRGITPWPLSWSTATPTGADTWGWDNDGSYGDWYGAHEIGHALGRPHIGRLFGNIGCGADWYFIYPEYPYDTGKIGGPSNNPDRFFGFDGGDANLGLITRVVPSTFAENMGYCANEWFSDWTYLSIRDFINAHFPALNVMTSLAAPAAPSISGDYLYLQASILTTTQTANIELISRLTEVGALDPVQAGGYEVRLFNSSNTLLSSYPVSPSLTSDGGGLYLGQVVTFTAGTRRVAIYSASAGQEIGSVAVSANSPVVSNVNHTGGVNLPASGPVGVTWSAADSDGGPLSYSLQYSFQGSGGPWRTLATGLPTTSATVDAAELESTNFSGQNGYFRVVASDGVNTGSDLSDVFSVANKTPVASITNPADLSQYGFGQTVSLVGVGQDFEDGTLGDAALCWDSSLDGALGCGLEINPNFLSVGVHQITLMVTDSESSSGFETVQVEIVEDYRTLIPTLPRLEAEPRAGMMFLANAGGPNPPAQELLVRDLAGIASDLAYTVTVTQPWVSLSAPGGVAPGIISVTVSIAGMPAGTLRSADLTITAAGAQDSPRVIHLTLQTEGPPPRRIFLPVMAR